MRNPCKCEKRDRNYHVEYNREYDSAYCTDCFEWVESICGDTYCEFCGNRPENARDLDADSQRSE